MKQVVAFSLLLSLIVVANAHMWIYEPSTNRFGPDGGTAGLSNTNGGNLGHDAAKQGSSTQGACANSPFKSTQAKATVGVPVTTSFIWTDTSNDWDVFVAKQPDTNLAANKVQTINGKQSNQKKDITSTFTSEGVWTIQSMCSPHCAREVVLIVFHLSC
jgi:hypothetical protein